MGQNMGYVLRRGDHMVKHQQNKQRIERISATRMSQPGFSMRGAYMNVVDF